MLSYGFEGDQPLREHVDSRAAIDSQGLIRSLRTPIAWLSRTGQLLRFGSYVPYWLLVLSGQPTNSSLGTKLLLLMTLN